MKIRSFLTYNLAFWFYYEFPQKIALFMHCNLQCLAGTDH